MLFHLGVEEREHPGRPLLRVRDERLHVSAVLHQPQLGVWIRARGLEVEAVVHRHGVIVLALDEEEGPLRMRADEIGRAHV